MKVSAVTILRNGVALGYPFLETIRSVLPIVDEYVVVVGRGDDETGAQVAALNDPRVRIVETEWSPRVTPRRCLLAQQTNIGLHLCRGDWVICLQGNEALHEASLDPLLALMREHVENPRVEALLTERLTFWGDYRHAIRAYPERFKFTARVIRPYIGCYAIRDAMSVAVFDGFSTRGRYPRALDTGLNLFRYGFVGAPADLAQKARRAVHRRNGPGFNPETYLYRTYPRRFVAPCSTPHPAVMADRIARAAFALDDTSPLWRRQMSLREWVRWIETRLYERVGPVRWRSPRYSLIGSFIPKARPWPEPLNPIHAL